MSPSTRLAFVSLGAFFVLLPLAVPHPGMPPTLKADEPAYYLMALSLVRDGDLRCETEDLRRLYDAYPHLPVENLILMSNDGWRSVVFGKPYIYSLIAAPAAAIAGARGMVSLNMALMLAMVWMGFAYLRRFNSEALSALFAFGYFVLSSGFAYVFWLHPEVLNMSAVAASLFLAFHRFAEVPPGTGAWRRLVAPLAAPGWRALLSGAVLAIAVYNKPMLAPIGLAPLYLFWRRGGARAALTWLVAAAVALAAIAGGSTALTGEPTPYLGGARAGFKIEDPEGLEDLLRPLTTPAATDGGVSSFGFLAGLPDFHPRMLAENLGYFFWGRHTGILLYTPFAGIALVLFLAHRRRSVSRWLTLGALAVVALYFMIWIHYNWHGGAGFIGNRYFVNLYPAFLFLVTAIRPAWVTAFGFVAGGLFLGPILVTPYGASIPAPTLQAHTRGAAFEAFPMELSIGYLVPGYTSIHAHGVSFRGRRDLLHAPAGSYATLWLRGAARTEILVTAAQPLAGLAFEARSPVPGNELVLAAGGARARVMFDDLESQSVRLAPLEPTRVRSQYGKKLWIYRLLATTRSGRNPRDDEGRVLEPRFYLGAELRFLAPGAGDGG